MTATDYTIAPPNIECFNLSYKLIMEFKHYRV